MVKTPKFVQRIFPERIWAFPISDKKVFLTFDDGPIPEVTPWVLDILKTHKAKATFFCIGDNVRKHSEVFRRILDEGHSIGNHTFNHLSGWKTEVTKYVENVALAEHEINTVLNRTSKFEKRVSLFRPPYGRLTSRQSKIVRNKGYKVIMWDVLSGDFDVKISEEKCYENVCENMELGSIVVFHDSLKAEKHLRYCLPKILKFISKKGWTAVAIQN